MLGAGEDQHPTAGPALEHGQQQLLLEPAGDRIEGVRDGLGRRDHADLDGDRVVQDAVRQPADVLRHGGREEQRLALRRHLLEDAADVGQEAHVAHAVGLVQHQHLDLRQVDAALAETGRAGGRGRRRRCRRRGAAPRPAGSCSRRRRSVTLRRPVRAPYSRVAWWICSASSRVGARISARTPRPGWVARRCRMGSMKAAVLPVPVWARPIRSRPARTGGMACCWMGVGVV